MWYNLMRPNIVSGTKNISILVSMRMPCIPQNIYKSWQLFWSTYYLMNIYALGSKTSISLHGIISVYSYTNRFSTVNENDSIHRVGRENLYKRNVYNHNVILTFLANISSFDTCYQGFSSNMYHWLWVFFHVGECFISLNPRKKFIVQPIDESDWCEIIT